MLIKMWQLIILYFDWMDWRAGHLTTTEGTGVGAFANKNCPHGQAFGSFSNARGYAREVCPGGMLAPVIDSHFKQLLHEGDHEMCRTKSINRCRWLLVYAVNKLNSFITALLT